MKHLFSATLGLLLTTMLAGTCIADVLLLANKKQIQGAISLIADDYIEFEMSKNFDQKEWVKIPKQYVVAVVNENGKIVYPRDKFDENALNYGKIKFRTEKEKEIYLERKKVNKISQVENEKRDNNRYKVAAIVGGISSLMLWAFLDGK